MTRAGLEIEGLSAGYRGRRVLDTISLGPLAPGHITALVGPNAAGKSTLLKSVAGLVAFKGRVLLDGENLTRQSPAWRAARVGFMPQGLPQGIGLNVLEAVMAADRASAHGATEASTCRERSLAALDRLGIVAIALSPLGALSGGQRQLASLAQAIVRRPKLLLLDEPTSALDLRAQYEVMAVARQMADAGSIVVVVLHDLNLASRWADNVVLLHGGKVHAAGSARATLTPANLAAVYHVGADVTVGPDGYPRITVLGPAPAA